MSDIYLIVALFGTFFSVVFVLLAVDLSVTERQRAVRLLEAQVGSQTATVDPHQELEASFGDRVGRPLLQLAARIGRRLTPTQAWDRVTHKLVLAGAPERWDAERVIALKVVGGVGGLVLGLVVAGRFGSSKLAALVAVALLSFAGFIFPDVTLDRNVAGRQRQIRKVLPDFLDMLTISVEAGLSLTAALSRAVQTIPGPLSQEFARMLQEIQLGISRSDAFKHVADRTDVEELNGFVVAMMQADIFGISISKVLRTQAAQLRVKRRQRIEMRAQQTPVKIVFPLILCVLPSLFVVIIGPGAIRLVHSFLGGG